jgi:hypothetical protein
VTRRVAYLCVVSVAACWGCGRKPSPPAIEGQWLPARVTRVQVQPERLGELPNNGLQLPVVSPDGCWIAYLEFRGQEPLGPEALLTGRGLEAMSLYVQEVRRGAPARLICPSGAAWPAWSGDSKRLAFVVYDPSGRCELGIYDVEAGADRRIGTGLKRMMMPAVSPSGDRVAVVAPTADPTTSAPAAETTPETVSARLHLLTVATGKIQGCPGAEAGFRQLWPQWTADGRIFYVLAGVGRAWLAQWRPPDRDASPSGPVPGRLPPQRLCEIYVPTSDCGVYQTFAGLGRPLGPDDREFAYYDTARARIVLLGLTEGALSAAGSSGVSTRTELPAELVAGCWLGPRQFVAASGEEMVLIADGGVPIRLMRGPWLPRGTVGRTSQLILCAPGSHPRAFALVRMKVISAK